MSLVVGLAVLLLGCQNNPETDAKKLPTRTPVATETPDTTAISATQPALSATESAPATPTNPPTATNTPEPTATPAPDGSSRSRPIPMGVALRVGDWFIQVNDVIPDGTSMVLAENRFNDPPGPGRQFFIASISAQYVGDEEPSTLFGDLSIAAVGASNVGYEDFDETCGVIPNELDTFKDVFREGIITGNLCWAIESSDAGSMLMYVEPSFSFDDVVRWFSLQ